MSEPAYYLDINGLSHHFRDPPAYIQEWNEVNPGLGITRETVRDKVAKALSAGFFNNSYNNPSAYLSGSIAKQFGDDYYARLGGMAGLMTGYEDTLQPIAGPMATLGKNGLGRLNIVYAPGMDGKGNQVMMNLGIPFK